MARTKLTDKQKKKIISDYAINNNKRETARLNNTTVQTVMRLLKKDNGEVNKKVAQKKEENTNSLLAYIDCSYQSQKEIIDLTYKALREKLRKPDAFTNVKDIATVYGIFTDKALKFKELKLKERELELKEQELKLKNKEIDTAMRITIVNDLNESGS